MHNLLKHKVFIDPDRSVVLERVWAQVSTNSVQRSQTTALSGCHNEHHVNTDTATSTGRTERVRVLLIGFEDSQVGTHSMCRAQSGAAAPGPQIRPREVPTQIRKCTSSVTVAVAPELLEPCTSRCPTSVRPWDKVAVFNQRRSRTLTGCQ